jgi:hypothetical protein
MQMHVSFEGNNIGLSIKIAAHKINEVLRAHSTYFVGFAEGLCHGVEHSVCEACF